MFEFVFHVPTKLIFKVGSLKQVAEVVRPYGHRALLVIGCSSAREAGLLSQVRGLFDEAGVAVEVIDGIRSNPSAESVCGGAALINERRLDVVVALGGGSVIDAAKLMSLAATHEGDFWEYRVTGTRSVPSVADVMVPVVAVPTVAGTGSELSPAALATKGMSKEVFYSPYMFPKATVVDPSLALSVPPRLSAQIGIDALVQGLEAFVALNATPFSDTFALEAIKVSVNNIKRVMADGHDLEARTGMALAAILSLFAINQAGVGAVHALSDPLSGRYDVHHGLALASVFAEVVNFNLDANPAKYAKAAEVLGADLTGASVTQAARKLPPLLRGVVKELGLYRRLRDLGVGEVDVPVLAREAQNPDMATNPKKMSADDIEGIYRRIL